MTAIEYAETFLPEPIRKRYIYNCVNHLRVTLILDKEYVASPALFAVGVLFTSETPEGDQYWNEISTKYISPLKPIEQTKVIEP
jgi:hypothetical protein